ncbi:MAG: hypothetical protein WCC63_07550 [Candidatus Bathyarchaeia archaeon]
MVFPRKGLFKMLGYYLSLSAGILNVLTELLMIRLFSSYYFLLAVLIIVGALLIRMKWFEVIGGLIVILFSSLQWWMSTRGVGVGSTLWIIGSTGVVLGILGGAISIVVGIWRLLPSSASAN